MARKVRKARKAKRDQGPRELELFGALCLAFANTGFPRRDDRRRDKRAPPSMPLARYGELVTWCERMDVLGAVEGEGLRRAADERPDEAAAVLARGAALRSAVGRIFTRVALGEEPGAKDLAIVNGALCLRAVAPDGDGFRWRWTGDAFALDRVLFPVAQSAAELLISDDLPNVDQCAAKGCFQLFVRRSPRRLWCDMNTCGNRLKGKRRQQYLRGLREERRLRQLRASRGFTEVKAAAAAAQAGSGPPSHPEKSGKDRLDVPDPSGAEAPDGLETARSNGPKA